MNPETASKAGKSTEKKRVRRTKLQVESDIQNAIDQSILSVGYQSIQISDILEKAHIEPGVFYNRYNDMDVCRKVHTRKFDYWLGDHSDIDEKQPSSETLKSLIMSWCKALKEDPLFIKLLLWEMTEKNDMTAETQKRRENQFDEIASFFGDKFSHLPYNYRYLIILLFGGTLYMGSMSKYSKLLGINMKEKKSKDEFMEMIEHILNMALIRE